MAGQYSLKTFLRQVRGPLLNRCLRQHGITLDLDFPNIKPSAVDPVFDRLMQLPSRQLQLVETDFAAIAQMASARGTEALLREARFAGVNLADIFLQARNGYERACWVYLEHPQVFTRAACFHELDRFGEGRWHRRYIGRGVVPSSDPQAVHQLEAMIRRSLAREGRGRFCHVDHYVRQEPLRHCFFAFPEDHTSTDLAYTPSGQLCRRTRRAAFEIIFVFRPEEGVLEVLAPGGADKVEELASCFCSAILKLPELPPKIVPRVYDLSPLKAGQLEFPTDPADGIQRVELREIRLNLGRKRGWKRIVSFSADDRAFERANIHQMVLDTVNSEGVNLRDVYIASARFRIVFAPVDNQRPKRLTFTVTGPDRCTLRDNYHDQIARKCLRAWGLVVDGLSAPLPGRSGPARANGLRL